MLKKLFSRGAKQAAVKSGTTTGKLAAAKQMNQQQLNHVINKSMHKSNRAMMRETWNNRERTISKGLHKLQFGSKLSLHGLAHSRTAQVGSALLGAVGMTAISVMNGAMSAVGDNMTARYMQDSRYSSRLLQHRVGNAAGNSRLNIGNHTGLSLSMSKARHG